MIIKFENALVMNVRRGNTRSGNDFAILKFLDTKSGEDYKIWCFGDAVGMASFCQPMRNFDLTFELVGDDQNGGVRLTLVDSQPTT